MKQESIKGKFGFTLAEVLITLGIIGVVAAMTLPTLINNGRDRETVSKLKKMHTVLNQAFIRAVEDNGTPDNWGYVASGVDGGDPDKILADQVGRDNVMKKFAPYLKATSVCYYTDSVCSNNTKYSRERYSLDGTRFGNWGTPRIMLADGSTIDTFYMSSPTCTGVVGTSKHLQSMCGEIFVDINGMKPPNATGKDIFWFIMTKYGIVPGGIESSTIRSFDNYCNMNKRSDLNGYGCTAWVIYNENLDYLKCNDLSWDGKSKCKQ